MSFVRGGALSNGNPAPAAMAAPDMPMASMKPTRIFFICSTLRCNWLGSVRLERDAAGHSLELTQSTPPRHEEEEPEIEQGTHLRHALANGRWRQHTQVTQNQEVDHEDAVQPLVPAGAVANGLHGAVIQPGQEE